MNPILEFLMWLFLAPFILCGTIIVGVIIICTIFAVIVIIWTVAATKRWNQQHHAPHLITCDQCQGTGMDDDGNACPACGGEGRI